MTLPPPQPPSVQEELWQALSQGQVHLHWCPLDPIGDGLPPWPEAFVHWLCPGERQALQRINVPHAQHQYLATRALVRTTLSRYRPTAPQAWRFVTGAHGRPEIGQPQAHADLRFNLSHTRGLVVCAVAWQKSVGVDVENTRRPTDTYKLSQRFFSPAEAQSLAALPPEQQKRCFFELWTTKEAVAKSRGEALATLLRNVEVRLDGEQDPTVTVRIRTQDGDPGQVSLLDPTPDHVLAVAVPKTEDALHIQGAQVKLGHGTVQLKPMMATKQGATSVKVA